MNELQKDLKELVGNFQLQPGIYKRESFMNNEGEQITRVVSESDPSQQWFLTPVPFPTPNGMVNIEIDLKATSITNAFELLPTVVQNYISRLKETLSRQRIATPASENELKLIS